MKNENVDHQEILNYKYKFFPFTIHETRILNKTLKMVDWHWHDAVQMIIVLEGEIEVYLQGITLYLSKGDGLYINTKILHRILNRNGFDSTFLCCNFDPIILFGMTNSLLYQQYVSPILHSSIGALMMNDACCRNLLMVWNYESKNDMLDCFICLLECWKELIRSLKTDNKIHEKKENSELTRQIMDYITCHFCEAEFSLHRLSEVVSTSKNHCCKVFKKNTGSTIFEVLLRLRIEKAADYLLNTSLSIQEIAYLSGFNDVSYFCRIFRKMTQFSPNQYRKMNRTLSN